MRTQKLFLSLVVSAQVKTFIIKQACFTLFLNHNDDRNDTKQNHKFCLGM